MNDTKLATLAQIREFLVGAADVSLEPQASRTQRYEFVRSSPEKSLVRAYLARMTGSPGRS